MPDKISRSGSAVAKSAKGAIKIKARAIVGAAVVLLILAVYASWPRAGFKLFMEEAIAAGDPLKVDRLKKIVRLASARTDRFAEHRSRLSIVVDTTEFQNSAPAEVFSGALRLGELASFSLGIKFEEDWGHFSADFKGDRIFQAVQADIAERLGVERYYLVIQVFDEWSSDKSDPDQDHSQILAYIYPAQQRPVELPYRSGAVDDVLADLMAHNLVTIVAEDPETCSRILCYSQLSESLTSLDRTVKGFDIMLRSRGHPDCQNQSLEVCQMRSEEEFRAALELDPDNDHAHFGFGMLKISRARSLNENASAYAVGRQLIEGFGHLYQATQSNAYLSGLIESDGWKSLVERSDEFRGLGLTMGLISSADAYRRARIAMTTGDYDKAISEVGSLGTVPAWLEGHVASLKTHAGLLRSRDRTSALQQLEEYEAFRGKVDDSVWAQIYGLGAARWAGGDPEWQRKARDALELAVSGAPNEREILLDTMAIRGAGYALLGDFDEGRGMADQVSSALDGTESGKLYGSVYLSLGLLYISLGEMDNAETWLEKAVMMNKNYISLITNNPLFDDFTHRPDFEKWRLKVISR